MADILNSYKATASSSSETKADQDQSDQKSKKGPGGIVLGKDGKPCRTCMSAADWAAMTGKRKLAPNSSSSSNTAQTTSTPPPTTSSVPPDCPPDVNELGRSTWTLLHTMTANYPSTATPTEQSEMRTFLSLFSKLYPCWFCAEDFRTWMSEPGGKNEPRLSGRSEFGNWMCEAHNAVNRKLGKKEFDCKRWEERWRTGWKDGRCDG